MLKKILSFGLLLMLAFAGYAQRGSCIVCAVDEGVRPWDDGPSASVSLSGSTSVRLNGTYIYYVRVSGGSHYSSSYSVSGGQILSQNNSSVRIKWTSPGSRSVRVTARVGSNYYSSTRYVRVNGTLVTAPRAINASEKGTTSFQANWNGVNGAVSYRLDVATTSNFSKYVSGYRNLPVGPNSPRIDEIQRIEGSTSYLITGLHPGNTYYYRVRAVGNANTSGYSNVITTNTTIANPKTLEETANSSDRFTARWNAVNGARSYRLYVATNSSYSSYVSGYNGKVVSGSSFTVTGLRPGTRYYYRVRAVSPVHTSGYSNSITAHTTVAVPRAIEESGNSMDRFTARWNGVSGAASYRLYVSTNSSFSNYISGYNGKVVTGTSHTIARLQPGKKYYYRVRAVSSYHTSGYSATITAHTTIAIPRVISETGNSLDRFTARWGGVTGATSYRLYVSTNSSYASYVSGYNGKVVTGTSHTIAGLNPGKNYYYRVRAVSASYTSGYSGSNSAHTTIDQPKAVSENGNGTDRFTARWGSVNGALSYQLFIATDASFGRYVPGYVGKSVRGTSFTVTGLTPGRNYYYRVRAVGSSQTSGYSGSVTAHTKVAAPPKMEETGNGTDRFTARWGSVTGAASYQVFVGTDPSFKNYVYGYNGRVVTGTSLVVTGLQPGKNYYYRVRALSPAHTSGYSGSTTAHTTIGAPVSREEDQHSTSSFRANWTPVANAVSYRLDVSTQSNFLTFVQGYKDRVVQGTSTVVSFLEAGKNYYYRVRAMGPDRVSTNSNTTTANTTIHPPVMLPASNIRDASFQANWRAVTGVMQYRLDVARDASFTDMVTGFSGKMVNGVRVTVNGLDPGTQYYYRVRAVGSAVTSGHSKTISVVTTISAPKALPMTNQSLLSFQANWEPVEGVENYLLDVSPSESFDSYLEGFHSREIKGTSQTIYGASGTVNHYYRVRARGTTITSDYSETITARSILIPGLIVYQNKVCKGENPGLISGTPAIGGDADYVYRWQYHNGSQWVTLATGAEYQSYDPTIPIHEDTQFRRLVKSGDRDWISTGEITIPVFIGEPSAGSLSANADLICPGKIIEFSYVPHNENINTTRTFLEVYRDGTWMDLGGISGKKSVPVYRDEKLRVRYDEQCSKVYSNEVTFDFLEHCNVPPSMDRNFVRTEVALVPVKSQLELSQLDTDDKAITFSYSDGAGRPAMEVSVGAGKDEEDLIQFYAYDDDGRQSRAYLPYADHARNPGGYRTNHLSAQSQFYIDEPDIPHDSRPYATTEWDSRGRVSSVVSPGEDWAKGADPEQHKAVRTSHRFYQPQENDQVAHWIIEDGLPVNDRAYGANELTQVLVTNEQGTETRTLTDTRGLEITTEIRDADNGKWYGSVKVYDDFGRVRFIIPPILVAGMDNSFPNHLSDKQVKNLLFQYEYDRRGRLIREKAPGSGWKEYIYDQFDRLVMHRYTGQTRNGKQAWSFVKYDRFNRKILTGIVATNKTREILLLEMSQVRARFEEEDGESGYGYTISTTYPNTGTTFKDFEVHTVQFYDDYEFLTEQFQDGKGDYSFRSPEGFDLEMTTAVLGLPTGSKTRIPGTDDWLNTVVYYDDYSRPVQTISDNHTRKGGRDVMSHAIDFSGKTLKTLREHTGLEDVTILKEYEYARNGQLIRTWQTIEDQRVLVAEYWYNVLGELTEKNLHSTDGGTTFLQSVDYTHNIRGWMTGINSPELTDEANKSAVHPDVFGIRYHYTQGVKMGSNTSDGNIAGRFDGMVSSMEWKASNGTDQDLFKKSMHGFTYDGRNRLNATDYATYVDGSGWIGDYGNYSMTADYDDNGNIRTMDRKSEGELIDELTYTYDTESNRLKAVDDSQGSVGFSNFNPVKQVNVNMTTEYQYDKMGNMTHDPHKEMYLHYNHMQLVDRIDFGDEGTVISSLYDAVGNKLSRIVTDSDGNEVARVDYVGGIEYFNGRINQIFTDEGRAYKQNGAYHYEYFITDHQGNNRVAFGHLPVRNLYTASMEDHNEEKESSEFAFEGVLRTTLQNHTPFGQKSVALNNAVGRTLGPSKVIDIAANDEIDIEVWAKYTRATGRTGAFGDVLTSLISVLGTTSGDGGAGEALSNTLGSGGPGAYLPVGDANNATDAPDAYLAYLFFDKDYQFDSNKSGFLAVTDDSYQKFSRLQTTQMLTFDEPGYLYVYLANESREDQEVYFDDLKITHESASASFRVTQVNEYYPFGLHASNSWRAPGYIDPGLLYQSPFAQYDSLTGFYDFLSRSYDPALGRFFAVDPAGQFASPYVGMGNVPHMMVDPNGEWGWLVNLAINMVGSLIQSAGQAGANSLNGSGSFMDNFLAQGVSSGVNYNFGSGFAYNAGNGYGGLTSPSGGGAIFGGLNYDWTVGDAWNDIEYGWFVPGIPNPDMEQGGYLDYGADPVPDLRQALMALDGSPYSFSRAKLNQEAMVYGVSGVVSGFGGIHFSVGVIERADGRQSSKFFTIGPAVGADASIGIFAGSVKHNFDTEFHIDQYKGYGTADSFAGWRYDYSRGGDNFNIKGGNSPSNSFATPKYGRTYIEDRVGMSFGNPIGYTRQMGYTTFWRWPWERKR